MLMIVLIKEISHELEPIEYLFKYHVRWLLEFYLLSLYLFYFYCNVSIFTVVFISKIFLAHITSHPHP